MAEIGRAAGMPAVVRYCCWLVVRLWWQPTWLAEKKRRNRERNSGEGGRENGMREGEDEINLGFCLSGKICEMKGYI